jgi:Flp pilus assembly protein TadG
MIAGPTRLLGCRRGISAVEMALVSPLFFAVLLGVINVSLVLWTQASLYFAAQAAARCASATPSICGSPASGQLVENYAMSQYFGQSLGDAMPFRYQRETCGHRVTASYRYPLTIPFYESPELDLSASACFPAGGSTG